MLLHAALQIVGWVTDFLTLTLLARVLMQWARAPFRNPLGEFIFAVTNWAVVPMRRVIPGVRGVDLASLLLAWLAQVVLQGALHALWGMSWLPSLGAISLLAFVSTLRVAIYLLIGIILISALFSWVNPHAPLAPLFDILARPFLRPLQRVIPIVGNVDLSPLVLLLALQLLLGALESLRIVLFQ